jgi:hypothetical protein
MSAALAAGLAALLVLGAATDPVVLVLAVAVAQLLLAAVWFGALEATGGVIGRLRAAAAAVAADIAVLSSDDSRPMAHVGPVLAVTLLAAFGQQLVRRDGRERLTGSLTATGSAVVVGGLGAAWPALDAGRDGTALAVVAAVAVAATPAADLAGGRLALPRWASAVVAALGTGAAALVVAGGSDLEAPTALAAAAVAAVAARLGTILANRVPVPHLVLPAVLPALLVAPATYVLARVLLG